MLHFNHLFRKSMKPASESRGRSTTWGPKSVTSKSSHCTPRCLRSSSRGSSSHPHPINQMVPSEGRYKWLVAIKNTQRGRGVEIRSLRERVSERENEWVWCRKARWGIRCVKEESWKVGTETFFPFSALAQNWLTQHMLLLSACDSLL